MSAWHNISTAPKDGSEILLAEIRWKDGVPNYGEIDVGAWEREPMSRDEFGKDHWAWFSNYGRVEEPTHWMPLPDPPKEGT